MWGGRVPPAPPSGQLRGRYAALRRNSFADAGPAYSCRRSAALGHCSTAARTSISRSAGTGPSAICTTSSSPNSKMSAARDSQNPFASHMSASTITRIGCPFLLETHWPGPDHPAGGKVREFLLSQPALSAQYVFIVLAERGRGAQQPSVLPGEQGER